MEIFFWVAGSLVVGTAFGWFLREQHAMRVVNKMFEHAEKKESELKQENIVKAKLEVHHGHYYLFDAETDAFLGQGETAEELSAMLRKKFPEKSFALNKEAYATLGDGNDFTV